MTANIVDCMFAACPGIKTVTLPDSLTSLRYGAFDEDVKLGPPTHPLVNGDEGDSSFDSGDSGEDGW